MTTEDIPISGASFVGPTDAMNGLDGLNGFMHLMGDLSLGEGRGTIARI
jgi:hypothetical protein